MSAKTLRVVSWNVWFGHWAQEQRHAALWAELERLAPDVICLQEVVPEHLAGPQIERLRERGHWISNEVIFDYDVITLTRMPVRASQRVALPTTMGRELLLVRLGTDPPLTIANVHLESRADETACRVRQLERITACLAEEPDVVLLGDMNFPALGERPENRPLAGWTDAWAQLRPGDPGFTIDSEINRMRWLHKRAHDQRRIDRVFCRSPRWVVSGIEVVGREPLPGDPLTFISDHFGLCVDLHCAG
ncbi:MAG TPA: endonuclease/exonuclease/phosphatase family protein [Enhygromyxa sp.]|nr:endonuclease/exonuclease/phosphatase family protein [Enhygromyxa sp.]